MYLWIRNNISSTLPFGPPKTHGKHGRVLMNTSKYGCISNPQKWGFHVGNPMVETEPPFLSHGPFPKRWRLWRNLDQATNKITQKNHRNGRKFGKLTDPWKVDFMIKCRKICHTFAMHGCYGWYILLGAQPSAWKPTLLLVIFLWKTVIETAHECSSITQPRSWKSL